jgi:membrane protease YdiL (CAAX protease family)
MKTVLSDIVKKHPLTAFFVLAFSLTWIGSTVYYFAVPNGGQILPAFLATPSGIFWYYGPCLAAVIVTRVSEGKESVRRLLKRLLDWRVDWKWYAFIFLYPFGLHLAVVYLDRLLGGPAPVFFQARGLPQGNVWLVLIGLIIFQVLVRGIGEETGWRGFALPRLQSRWNPLVSSLILGLLWSLWHFHPANSKVFLSAGGIFLFVNVFLTTIIFTWFYNHTHGSIFMAAMFHMTVNVVEFVVPIGMEQAGLTRNLLQIALILATITMLLLGSGPLFGKEVSK